MSISIEKIIQSVKQILGQGCAPENVEVQIGENEKKLELNDEEKSVILMLENAGFFGDENSSALVEKIKRASEFIADNIFEIFDRTSEFKNIDVVKSCSMCGAVGISGATFCYNCGAKIVAKKISEYKFEPTKWTNKFFEVAKVPGFEMALTPITQEVWTQIMKNNPSYFKGDENPVDQISWFDAIYFCNVLSDLCNYSPCYFVNGKNEVQFWNYVPGKDEKIVGDIKCNFHCNGFRLPTISEWICAAKSRDDFLFSGSDCVNDVAWFRDNSQDMTHSVSLKKPNSYGLYDMSGNVYEWCWDLVDGERCYCGGSWKSRAETCENSCVRTLSPEERIRLMGMRVVRSI